MKYSCKHVTVNLSESLDQELTITDKIMIKFHLLMCRSCQQIEKQLNLLNQSVKKVKQPKVILSVDSRNRILKNLKNKL